jgi:hypothetical protein
LNLQVQYINPSWLGSRVIDSYLEIWLIRIGFISFPYFEIGVQVWVSNYYYVVLNLQILPTSTHGLRSIPTDRYLGNVVKQQEFHKNFDYRFEFNKILYGKCPFNHIGK